LTGKTAGIGRLFSAYIFTKIYIQMRNKCLRVEQSNQSK
jgi:hypothetical protein